MGDPWWRTTVSASPRRCWDWTGSGCSRSPRPRRAGRDHRDDGDAGRLRELRRAGRGAGPDADRHPRSGLLRAAGPAGVEQAPVALRRGRLRDQDVDRALRPRRRPGRADTAGRRRGVPPGRADARPVAAVAAELGVCWWTVMNAVIEHGTPLVDDPDRIGTVTQLGVDETSFLTRQPDPCHDLRHRPGRPQGQGRDRHGQGQHRR